jgi:hypothetical protein
MAADPLLKDLAGNAPLFAPLLAEKSRRWFAAKLLTYVRASTASADVEAAAESLLLKVRALTKARLDSSRGDVEDELKRLTENRRRTEVCYGLVGGHPSVFLDVPNRTLLQEKLLVFLFERRVQSVRRVTEDIKDQDVFGFCGLAEVKPSSSATTFWSGITSGGFPFILSAQGKQNPVAAVGKLFEVAGEQSDFDCAVAAMVVHLDALREAAKPDDFLDALTSPQDYFALDHPYGSVRFASGGKAVGGQSALLTELAAPGTNVKARALFAALAAPSARLVDGLGWEDVQVTVERKANGEPTGYLIFAQLSRPFAKFARVVPAGLPDFHVTTDQRPDRALFEQVLVPLVDLQIGDHVYLPNHPVFGTWSPQSPWVGEHAFRVDGPQGDAAGGRFSGHGIKRIMTPQELTDDLLSKGTNEFLDVVRGIVAEHVQILAAGTSPDPSNTAIAAPGWVQALLQKTRLATLVGTCDVFVVPAFPIKVGSESTEYPKSYTITMKGTLDGAQVTDSTFIAFNIHDKPQVFPPSDTPLRPVLVERLPPASLPARKSYGLVVVDEIVGTRGVFPLYHQFGPREGMPRLAKHSDVERPLVGASREDVLVLRPRVATDPAYLTFLTANGALGP